MFTGSGSEGIPKADWREDRVNPFVSVVLFFCYLISHF